MSEVFRVTLGPRGLCAWNDKEEGGECGECGVQGYKCWVSYHAQKFTAARPAAVPSCVTVSNKFPLRPRRHQRPPISSFPSAPHFPPGMRLQVFLAHKRGHLPPLGPPWEPRHGPIVGSRAVSVSYLRCTPVQNGPRRLPRPTEIHSA